MNTLFPLRYGIFLKLWTTFLAILIPIYVIAFFMSKSGVDIMRQQIFHLMEQKSAYFVSSMDSEFERISRLQLEFLGDSDLQDLSNRSETLKVYERTKAYNDLLTKLKTLASSSRYIKEAFVLMPHDNRRLSSINGYSEMDPAEFESFSGQKKFTSSGLSYMNNHVYFNLGFPQLSSSTFLLVIEISLDKIREEIQNPNTIGDGLAYIKSNDDGPAITVSSFDRDSNGELLAGVKATEEGTVIHVQDKSYLRFVEGFKSVNWSYVMLVDEEKVLQPVLPFKRWLWILSALSVIVVFVVSLSLLRVIHKPMLKLLKAFRQIETGQFDVHLQHRTRDEFNYVYDQFNQTVIRLNVLVKQVYEQTIRSQRSELKQLQSQINPHFFYNSLYILYRMAQEEDYEGVSAMSKHLGDYFKFITQNKSDVVSLDKEIQHAAVYVSIQQLRFHDRIVFQFDIEGPVDKWEVPRLIIQPFLENAIVHGHEQTIRDGRVDVRIRCDESVLVIEIEDNGEGVESNLLQEWERKLRTQDETDDHALWNVHRRLQLRYGETSGIRLQAGGTGGLLVTITINRKGNDTDV
ncbi:sensor histidine kinase [Cohnella silvisoli]|uniref:Sensor histidine kinase n=1 Tax=Cohnella silvisoli TaxID=2873699 RepID=A0ABV1KPE9_9BACL|nr:sensor histidine kinase [Cohnella silvisoli]MCD9025560.1 sensor histidine kinase [Cohnella silvisoli]